MPLPLIPPQDQLPPPLSLTNSPTSSHNTSPQHEESLSGSVELFSPTPSIIQNKWPSPPPPLSLNDPHALGEDIIHTIMQALAQRMGATMCVAVLVLPPPTTAPP